MAPRLKATVVFGHTFTVDPRYDLSNSRILGKGTFGVVCTAYDKVLDLDLALKRIRPYANDEWDARHCLGEIRLLKLLGPHPNIISIYNLSLFDEKKELYMAIEVMNCDLHRVIQSKQQLGDKHFKCFVKQMLEGIKAMHAIGVFHRDLKPGNTLVSKDCQLRITDFGLARFVDDSTRTRYPLLTIPVVCPASPSMTPPQLQRSTTSHHTSSLALNHITPPLQRSTTSHHTSLLALYHITPPL
jgi:serine/threonine protein kinase